MGMRFPMGMGIPWEWEFVTKLGMGMGKNGKQPVFPSADAVYCIIIIGCTLQSFKPRRVRVSSSSSS